MRDASSIATAGKNSPASSEKNPLDLLIIGAGPVGISSAIQAHKKGLKYLVIEKGCLTNSLFHYPLDMQFFSSSEKLELEDIPFNSTEAKPRRKEALEYYRRLVDHFNLQIQLFETVRSVDQKEAAVPLASKDRDSVFKINTSKGHYWTKNTVIATGFFDKVNTLNIPGESLPKVSHYFKEAHYYAGQKVAVIGASNSAIDAALACYRKGAQVSLIIRGPEIGPRVKYWVRPDILNRIEEGSIAAYYESAVKEIRESDILFTHEGQEKKIANDFVLALTGYRPHLNFLEQLGIVLEGEHKIPTHDPESMETNVKGIYLAGVICGGLETHKWFIENSRQHGARITDHIIYKG